MTLVHYLYLYASYTTNVITLWKHKMQKCPGIQLQICPITLCVISHTNDWIIYWCCLSSSERILSVDNIGLYDTHCHAGWQAVNHPSVCSILPDGKPKPKSMVWDPCDWFVGPDVTCLIQIQSHGSSVRNTQQSNDPETLLSLAWIKAKESN